MKMKKPTNLLRFIILILSINFIMQMMFLFKMEIFCNCPELPTSTTEKEEPQLPDADVVYSEFGNFLVISDLYQTTLIKLQ